MRFDKYCITLILLLFRVSTTYSQECRKDFCIDFRVNNTSIDPNYSKNTECLSEITSFIQKIEQDSTLGINKVSFCGSASPEGSYQLNHKLARARLKSLEGFVRSKVDIPDSIITRDDSYISWEILREKVVESDLKQKQAVLDIIALEPSLTDYPSGRHIDQRIVKLQKLDGGKVWSQIDTLYFQHMRCACVIFITYKNENNTPVEKTVSSSINLEMVHKHKEDPIVVSESQSPVIVTDYWTSRLYIKTNIVGWGMAISNIGAEIDLAKHWTFALPVYYSAFNYFTSSIKFRTLTVQPEFRYWFNKKNQKYFIGAHFGYAQYNVALNGDYRYQDHNGKSPALGGGISLGYRTPISKNNKWNIEFTLGAGIYDLNYDRYYNINNGKLIDTHHKTYLGVDNAAINISYCFELKKRKK